MALPVHPMEDLAQGCPNDLNCVFLHYGSYLLRRHNNSVFKSTQEGKQSLPGNTVAASKHLGVKALELNKKACPQLFELKGIAMLACEQMCIEYPRVKFRAENWKEFPNREDRVALRKFSS